ncbi:MAG: hypothetical protein ACPIOQ_09830 [Promethearchaeia archaeon]
MLSALRLAVAACLAGSVASFAPAAPGRLGSVSQLTAPALPLRRPAFCTSGCGFPLPPRALGHRPGSRACITAGAHGCGVNSLYVRVRACMCACVRVCVWSEVVYASLDGFVSYAAAPTRHLGRHSPTAVSSAVGIPEALFNFENVAVLPFWLLMVCSASLDS